MTKPANGYRWRQARAQVFREQRVCWLCGREPDRTKVAPHPDSPSVDHVDHLARGGSPYDPANLRLACLGCNQRRGVRARIEEPRASRDW